MCLLRGIKGEIIKIKIKVLFFNISCYLFIGKIYVIYDFLNFWLLFLILIF